MAPGLLLVAPTGQNCFLDEGRGCKCSQTGAGVQAAYHGCWVVLLRVRGKQRYPFPIRSIWGIKAPEKMDNSVGGKQA